MLAVLNEFVHNVRLHFPAIRIEHTRRRHMPGRLLDMNDFSEVLDQLVALVFRKVLN